MINDPAVWGKIIGYVQFLQSQRVHASVTIVIQNGVIHLIRTDQTWLPGNLPIPVSLPEVKG